MIKAQIALLTELAGRDGHIDERETELIMRIGTAHGLSREEIADLIQTPVAIEWDNLSLEDRFEMLHNVVALMKADNEIFDEEIRYCMDVATKLGFPLEAIMELYPILHSNLRLPSEVSRVKMKYMKYLKGKN